MPGAIGLGVLDAFGYGRPMISTNFPLHGPEFDYLKDGINGRVVSPWEDVNAYANAVSGILNNADLLKTLSDGSAAAASQYSIEDMATRFATGIVCD